jgi:hypothetical protein
MDSKPPITITITVWEAALFRESARLPPVPLPVGPKGPNGPVEVSQKVETDQPNTFLTSIAIPTDD